MASVRCDFSIPVRRSVSRPQGRSMISSEPMTLALGTGTSSRLDNCAVYTSRFALDYPDALNTTVAFYTKW
jgi:hypothetical protein